ncbi:MAG: hypothetical protein AVDCRST_MAG79-3017, partial [uncultured Thermoleophilia bacterium]
RGASGRHAGRPRAGAGATPGPLLAGGRAV